MKYLVNHCVLSLLSICVISMLKSSSKLFSSLHQEVCEECGRYDIIAHYNGVWRICTKSSWHCLKCCMSVVGLYTCGLYRSSGLPALFNLISSTHIATLIELLGWCSTPLRPYAFSMLTMSFLVSKYIVNFSGDSLWCHLIPCLHYRLVLRSVT